MNRSTHVCMCGAIGDKPHLPGCPFPCFSDDAEEQHKWVMAWHDIKSNCDHNMISDDYGTHCSKCGEWVLEALPIS